MLVLLLIASPVAFSEAVRHKVFPDTLADNLDHIFHIQTNEELALKSSIIRLNVLLFNGLTKMQFTAISNEIETNFYIARPTLIKSQINITESLIDTLHSANHLISICGDNRCFYSFEKKELENLKIIFKDGYLYPAKEEAFDKIYTAVYLISSQAKLLYD